LVGSSIHLTGAARGTGDLKARTRSNHDQTDIPSPFTPTECAGLRWELPDREILAFAKQNGVLGLYIGDARTAETVYPDLFQHTSKRRSDSLQSVTVGPDQVGQSRSVTYQPTGDQPKGQLPASIENGIVTGLVFNDAFLGVIASHFKGRERISMWRRESRRVRALLNIGADLARKKRIDPDEWSAVGASWDKRYLDRIQHADPLLQWLELVRMLKREVSGVSLSVGWNRTRERTEVELDYRGPLLSAIGLQLALTISKSDSLYTCSGCGKLYARSVQKRRPKRGQGNFCDECADGGVALRQADERRKAKMAEASRLQASDVSVNEIAERLHTTPASFRRWVTKGRKDNGKR